MPQDVRNLQLEAILGTKTKQKGQGAVATEVTTSKTQKERKRTENKTMGYLPRVIFFNAFQLGAESENQVFSSGGALILLPGNLCLPLLFLRFPLGNSCRLPGEAVNHIVPFPTSIIAPMSFSRDLPSVICHVPAHSITR